jgi:co-chaperonin GroES (HSP10)
MNIETFVPLNDRILIEVIKEEVQYSGNLMLAPSASKEKSNIGLIKAVPQGYNNPCLAIGMTVMYPTHSGAVIIPDPLATDPKEYRLIKDSELLGIFPN